MGRLVLVWQEKHLDADVGRAIAKWPDVPAVFGWMKLDRRGCFWVRDALVTHALSRRVIGRHYESDGKGRWYFQNGPQKVFVDLEETPLIFHWQGPGWMDQCGRAAAGVESVLADEAGNVYLATGHGLGLIDDRDLLHFTTALCGAERRELGPGGENALLEAIDSGKQAGIFWQWHGQTIALEIVPHASLEGRFGFIRRPRNGSEAALRPR